MSTPAPDDVVMVTTSTHDPKYRALMWFCVGCKDTHHIPVQGVATGGSSWGWNESTSRPTLTPSILKQVEHGAKVRCHSYVKDGVVRFLGDCGHELAGKHVAMLPENANPFKEA